jgi:GNAT superfamily N-acetyltransferase/shikimate kinase
MSGTGKSSALAELRRLGFRVIDTDEGGWTEWSQAEDGYVWREDRMAELLAGEEGSALYVSGTVSNQGRFYDQFDAVVLLSAPAEVLLRRIGSRTNNPYGKSSAQRELILRHVEEVEPRLRRTCTHEIDATQPLAAVVGQLAELAHETPARSTPSGSDERRALAARVQITPVDPEHRDAQYCLAEYAAELNRRSSRGFDPSVGATALPHEVRPPAGQFFVAYLDGEAIGCGAVKHHDDAPAELKRMWIAPQARGLGLGRRLLDTLLACARDGGARVAHIETSGVLTEAMALYRSTGWVEVPPFNDEPYADHWFMKELA